MELVRHLRLRCWLYRGGSAASGVTVTVGPRTASLRFAPGVIESGRLRRGELLSGAMLLSEAERIVRLGAELAWCGEDEGDVTSLVTLGVGGTWASLTAAARETVDVLVGSYRHTVLVVAPEAGERAWLSE